MKRNRPKSERRPNPQAGSEGIVERLANAKRLDTVAELLRELEGYAQASPSTKRKARRVAKRRRAALNSNHK